MPSFGREPRGARFPAGETGQRDHLTLKNKWAEPCDGSRGTESKPLGLAFKAQALWPKGPLRPALPTRLRKSDSELVQ